MKAEGKKVAIYARVSTDKQSTEMQLAEMRAHADRAGWIVTAEYIDEGISGGSTKKRPAYNAMMAAARRREFKILLIWKLDRLARSLRDLITTIDELAAWDVDLVAAGAQIDTTTPQGRLMYQIVGAMAEFERELIRERVRAGLAHAKAKGVALGRPGADKVKIREARQWVARGTSIREAERRAGLGEGVLRKRISHAKKQKGN